MVMWTSSRTTTVEGPAAVRTLPREDAVDGRYGRVFADVLAWCAAEGFQGYDPYDGCNTRHACLLRHAPVRLFLTYFHKFSPVNFRPALGVRKMTNLTALALISSALVRTRRDEGTRERVRGFIERILGRSLQPRYGFHCWSGNGLAIQSRQGYSSPTVPGVIGTEACARALFDFSRAWPDPELDAVVLSVRDFLLEVLLEDRGELVFFRYKPTTPAHLLTFNASMKALAFVADVNRSFGLPDENDVLRRAMRTLLGFQQADGAWNYSVDLRTGLERPQIDFHQGYMLDGILSFLEAAGPDADCEAAYRRGIAFYRSRQFTPDGRCHYRYPRSWPANIHNQAQGIVTFARYGHRDPQAADFARTVAEWTLRNMYDERGYFHYLRYPLFTNRIPFIRWGQAAMLYALAHLLERDRSAAAAAEPANSAGALGSYGE
jgi:hypothetical protein